VPQKKSPDSVAQALSLETRQDCNCALVNLSDQALSNREDDGWRTGDNGFAFGSKIPQAGVVDHESKGWGEG
jgi:hypothetical protein